MGFESEAREPCHRDGTGCECCRAAVLAGRVLVPCRGPQPLPGRREGTSNASSCCTDACGGAWSRGKAPETCLSHRVELAAPKNATGPSQAPLLGCCACVINVPQVSRSRRTNSSVLRLGIAAHIFISAKCSSVSVHTASLSLPFGTSGTRARTPFQRLHRLSGERGGSALCRGFKSHRAHPSPRVSPPCSCPRCTSSVAPPDPLVSGTQPENSVTGSQ